MQKAASASGAKVKVVAEKISGAEFSDGKVLNADFRVDGGPSSLFDAVAIIASDDGAPRLAAIGAAQDFVRDAYAHLKTIGLTENTKVLFAKAGLADADMDDARVAIDKVADAKVFIELAAKGKFWPSEPKVRPLPGTGQSRR